MSSVSNGNTLKRVENNQVYKNTMTSDEVNPFAGLVVDHEVLFGSTPSPVLASDVDELFSAGTHTPPAIGTAPIQPQFPSTSVPGFPRSSASSVTDHLRILRNMNPAQLQTMIQQVRTAFPNLDNLPISCDVLYTLVELRKFKELGQLLKQKSMSSSLSPSSSSDVEWSQVLKELLDRIKTETPTTQRNVLAAINAHVQSTPAMDSILQEARELHSHLQTIQKTTKSTKSVRRRQKQERSRRLRMARNRK